MAICQLILFEFYLISQIEIFIGHIIFCGFLKKKKKQEKDIDSLYKIHTYIPIHNIQIKFHTR